MRWSVGWWPANDSKPFAAFYAYAYPMPEALPQARVTPVDAGFDAGIGEFLLRYDSVRAAGDPEQAILDFYGSTYAAAAQLMGWNGDLTTVKAPPNSGALPRRRGSLRPRQ